MLRRRRAPVSSYSAAATAHTGTELIDGPASRYLLGGQTMDRHRIRPPGLQSEAEGPVRYRGLSPVGSRRTGQPARRAVAQCRGFREGDRGRPQTLSRTAAKGRKAGGVCSGIETGGPEDNAKDGKSRGAAGRGRSRIRMAHWKLARKIRPHVAHPRSTLIARAAIV